MNRKGIAMKRRYLWIVPIAGLLATGVAASVSASVFVSDGQMACSARGVGVGTVFPVQSGAH
jgi:hypothetical protein